MASLVWAATREMFSVATFPALPLAVRSVVGLHSGKTASIAAMARVAGTDAPGTYGAQGATAHRPRGDESQAFSGAIVDDGQNPEPAPICELIRHEVQRPRVIACHWGQHRCPYRSIASDHRASAPSASPTDRAGRASWFKRCPPPEQHMKAPIAEAAAFMCQRLHSLAEHLADFVAPRICCQSL